MPFGFCGSFKESSVNGESFFTIYGEDEKPFLGFSVWPGGQGDKLVTWLRIRQVWRRVGDADLSWLNFWTHVCLIVNVRSKEIKVSVNGQEPVSIIVGDLMIQAPKDPKGRRHQNYEIVVSFAIQKISFRLGNPYFVSFFFNSRA